MNKDELLKYYKYIALNEPDFWNQCLKEFGPEETKRMREESRKNIKTEYITTNPQSKPFFRNAFSFLMEKQEEGLIGWTEEDEDEFYGQAWDKYSRFEKSQSKVSDDEGFNTKGKGLNLFEDPDDEPEW